MIKGKYIYLISQLCDKFLYAIQHIGEYSCEWVPASAAESAANAAIEKLNDPGVENSLLSAGDIKKGGAVCECMLLSISSSLLELKR